MFLFLKRLLSILALTTFITISLKAQSITPVRGKIVDKESNTPLPGTNVVVIESALMLALTIAQAFTVEETKRYDGSFNDPARMVSGYALHDWYGSRCRIFPKRVQGKPPGNALHFR